MKCPKCNREDNPDASICSACGTELPQTSDTAEELDIRVSKLAVASCVFAILGMVLMVWARVPRFKPSSSVLTDALFFSSFLAIFPGLTAVVRIELSRGRLTGRAYAAIGIALPIAVFFFITILSVLARTRSVAYRPYCGTNLSGIGKAMLIYAQDYDDEFPRAGGKASKWGPTPNWKADIPAEAYGLNDGDGQASMSANLFLLVKFTDVSPKSFICKGSQGRGKKMGGDIGATEFTLAKYKVRGKDLIDLWDFGPDPSKHCSYTYHIPYGPYPLTTSSDPGMAVAADRNPWLASPSRRARPDNKDFQAFDPNGTRECTKRGNAFEHQEDGQNVLFVDGHASFEKQSSCGVNDDNIYTVQNGLDIRRGIPPTLESQPADPNDSLLVHDPPGGASK
ncbi:MAG TPA: zinc ribbon domain-containing protein [Sedimentisphaerales bacterium]|nr:zinc ribbon domain-containing protein [Sedimentisphaerales bacterium]